MLYRLGFLVLLLGMMTADSDSLVIPFVLVVIGSSLVCVAKRKEQRHETD